MANRISGRTWPGMVALIVAIGQSGTAAVERPYDLPGNPMLADAQLTDICFASPTHGWAVGDRGLVLHTTDGGRHWTAQSTPSEARLASVFFLDEQNGWAAGGAVNPFTPATSGVVLRTRDGGRTWTHDQRLALPALARIKFFDAARGCALGQASAYFPAGVYTTSDGGRSWAAVPAVTGSAWLTGDFVDPNTGAVAGRAGALAVIQRRGLTAVPADYGMRALQQMRFSAASSGWLVGDGGLVLATRDAGKSWQTTPADVPAALRDQFDFTALAVQGPHCWIAGSPGTRVLHSADGGQSWEVADTGQPLPIRALAFVDSRRGYAVGDLGTILSTNDGGRSWNRQRGEHRRAAFTGVFARASDMPLELLARLSADEGYLGTVELVCREDVEIRPTQLDRERQAHQAAALVGGSLAESAWRFPLRDAGLRLSAEQIVEGWNLANDGQAIDQLEAHLVGRIRMWRPSAVFTAPADVRGVDPLAHLVNQVVLRAVERAADPGQYPRQISDAGLQVWKVQKVYSTLLGDQSGTTNINTAQLSAQSGRTLAELAAAARGVLGGEATPSPATVGFRLLVNQVPQQLGERDIFSGLPLSPGGEARRAVHESAGNNLEAAKREAQLRRNLQAILTQAEDGGRDGRFLADFGEQTRQLEPSRAADVLVQLGERYQRQGRWELAAECFELVVERYPKSTLATRSLVWLVQYYASSEAAWRMRASQQHTIQQVTALQPARRPAIEPAPPSVGAQPAGAAAVRPEIGARADVARAGGTVVGEGELQTRLAKACGYARQIEQLQPGLYGEPVVRFPLAVAHRQQGLPGQAQKFYMALRHTRPADAWRDCALGELWLVDGKTEPPKPLCTCLRAQGKPYLDGKLEEPFWQRGKTVALHSPVRDDEAWGCVVMLAYDEEFLYWAVSCARAPGRKYVPGREARPRDADLADQDRIELLLDVDRDFATYYRLAVDSRGWTAESCWNDGSWNPQWFVAQALEQDTWTVEAAIPLAELTSQLPQAQTAWAVGLQRIVPGVGIQSWTQPATTAGRPEGFGYLVFEAAASAQ